MIILAFLSTLIFNPLEASSTGVLAIYGKDNREEISTDSGYFLSSQAVAARIPNYSFDIIDGSLKFHFVDKLSSPWPGKNVCPNQRFANQPTISDCTGFLVRKDILVTAGHCISTRLEEVRNQVTAECRDFVWSFDYSEKSFENINSKISLLSTKNMYRCSKVIYSITSADKDFAVIKLSRAVKGVKPLSIRSFGKVGLKQKLYTIGHPSGLPKKVTTGGKVLFRSKDNSFSTNLDTFVGSSGSPVFNSNTNQVEGILVRGERDYIMSADSSENCHVVNKCQNALSYSCENFENKAFEEVNDISLITDYL